MSVKRIPPKTPTLDRKPCVCRGIPIFLIFYPKHTFWALVRTASVVRTEAVLTCIHNVCFEQKYFCTVFFVSILKKILCILHGQVFVMLSSFFNLYHFMTKCSQVLPTIKVPSHVSCPPFPSLDHALIEHPSIYS